MPYFVTEPIKIEGTNLGYAIYPYQFSFLDIFRVEEEKTVRLKIFKLKKSDYTEICETLFQQDFSVSMQNSSEIKKTIKNFVVQNPQYVENVNEVKNFLHEACQMSK